MDSPMVLSYNGVYLWKQARVEKAGTFDVDKVREVLESGTIKFGRPRRQHHDAEEIITPPKGCVHR